MIKKVHLPGVARIITVASGKGGVGKSTVSANLALALTSEGYTVGLLDADIYGPSQGLMMGVASGTKPEVKGNLLQPIWAYGVQVMSIGFVTSERTPAVWRGPMASSALTQLLTQTDWQMVDYLIVDMPPGTGDIQLTMAQQVPVDGAIIVTTPQDIALLDARKGIEMFQKVAIPLLGVVENMSTHICPNCGHEIAIFGVGGGDRVAQEYNTLLLARLPLSLTIREQSDGGKPPVVADQTGAISLLFRDMARAMITRIETLQTSGPNIQILDN